MSIKKLRNQLFAAIAMVLVASIALGSSTYAWFANNNTVKADGMKINAKAEGTMLVISNTVEGLNDKKTSYTFDPVVKGENLYPVHPIYTSVSGNDVTAWNHAYSDKFDTAISNSTETAVSTGDLNAGKYYVTTDLYIGLDNTNDAASVGAITVTGVTLTSSGNTLLNSARVLMVDEDGKVIGCFGNGTCLKTKGTEYVAGDPGTPATADTMATLASDNTGTVIDGLSAGENVKVTLYIYFDGRDSSCTSQNFKADEVTCSLEFTAADA